MTFAPRSESDLAGQAAEFTKLSLDGVFAALPLVAREGLAGRLRRSRLRSVFWRLYFGLLPPPPAAPSAWAARAAETRQRYAVLVAQHLTSAPAGDDGGEAVDDPLSTAADSAWRQHYSRLEVERTVAQDCSRLHPDDEFFQAPHVRALLGRVLAVWALANPALGYRQGMHELAAVILCVYSADIRPPPPPSPPAGAGGGGDDAAAAAAAAVLDAVCAADGLEADVYSALDALLNTQGVAGWYAHSAGGGAGFAVSPTAPGSPTGRSPAAGRGVGGGEDAPVLQAGEYVQRRLLRRVDAELSDHLEALKVEPQLYCLRWLRVLFAREFLPLDAALLWDAALADSLLRGGPPAATVADPPPAAGAGGGEPSFVLCLCVALLRYVRDELLAKDYAGALRRVMHYPPVGDMHVLIQRAVLCRGRTSPAVAMVLGASPSASAVDSSLLDAARSHSNPGAASAPTLPSASPAGPAPPSLMVGGGGGVAELRRQVAAAREEADALKRRSAALGRRLETVTDALAAHWMSGAGPLPDHYVLAVAELKKIKDVLLFRLAEDD